MKAIAKLAVGLCLAAGLSFAVEEYRGKLVDAACYKNSTSKSTEKVAQTCAPTASTVDFALLESGGKARMLDAAGNAKAAEAFQKGLLKADKDGDVHVSIMASKHHDSFKVESVRGHKSDTSVH